MFSSTPSTQVTRFKEVPSLRCQPCTFMSLRASTSLNFVPWVPRLSHSSPGSAQLSLFPLSSPLHSILCLPCPAHSHWLLTSRDHLVSFVSLSHSTLNVIYQDIFLNKGSSFPKRNSHASRFTFFISLNKDASRAG